MEEREEKERRKERIKWALHSPPAEIGGFLYARGSGQEAKAGSQPAASALSRPAGCVVSLALMTLVTVEVLNLDVQILDTYFNAN